MFDTSALRKTSEVEAGRLPWRAKTVTMIAVTVEGDPTPAIRIQQAHDIEAKRLIIRTAKGNPNTAVLIAWPGEFRQDVFVVDDYDKALADMR